MRCCVTRSTVQNGRLGIRQITTVEQWCSGNGNPKLKHVPYGRFSFPTSPMPPFPRSHTFARTNAKAGLMQRTRHVIAGAWHEVRGWLSVRCGRLLRDDVTCALGYRQQLVGTLQRLCREDRASVEARVDRWLGRNYEPLFGQAYARRTTAAGAPSGHQEFCP